MFFYETVYFAIIIIVYLQL